MLRLRPSIGSWTSSTDGSIAALASSGCAAISGGSFGVAAQAPSRPRTSAQATAVRGCAMRFTRASIGEEVDHVGHVVPVFHIAGVATLGIDLRALAERSPQILEFVLRQEEVILVVHEADLVGLAEVVANR